MLSHIRFGSRRRGVLLAASVAALTLGVAGTAPASTVLQYTKVTKTVHGLKITIFTKPVDDTGEARITSGPDGDLWFTEPNTSDIAKFTISGRSTIFPTKTASALPWAIAEGSDGNIWFSEWNVGNFGKVTPRGIVTEYPSGLSQTKSIDAHLGSDGNVWFGTDYNGIARITPKGKITFFPVLNNSVQVTGVTLGPDKNIWYTEVDGPNVGKMTPKGVFTEYPAGFVGEDYRWGIAAGSDGRIWFPGAGASRIGAIQTNGKGLTYYTAGITGVPAVITAGPDGNLYFGETDGVVGRITTSGVVTEFPLPGNPGANFPVLGICAGPDGNIWFTNNNHAQVGRLALPHT